MGRDSGGELNPTEALERDGFVVLDDVDPRLTDTLTEMLASRSGLSTERIQAAGHSEPIALTPEVRGKLAREDMTEDLASLCLEVLGERLLEWIGPIVHVSRTFHYQMKARSQQEVILRGYSGDGREVEALYGIHNEFTAARVITSPSALVCWVPLCDFDAPAMYLYPGSHRLGLQTNRWLPHHEACAGIDRIGEPFEYRPRRGEVVIFHFTVLHGSGAAFRTGSQQPMDTTRISCDLRFFPFCGILDSPAHTLVDDPVGWIQRRLANAGDDLLRAPLAEALTYLGIPPAEGGDAALPGMQWARFLEGVMQGDAALRREAIERLVNVDVGFDPTSAYQERLRDVALTRRPYASIAKSVPEAARVLEGLDASA